MVVAEISVVPIGTGTPSISQFVVAALEVLDQSKLKYELTPMSTVIEGDLDTILKVTQQMHNILFQKGAQRVVTSLKIDERHDKPVTMQGKIHAVLSKKPQKK